MVWKFKFGLEIDFGIYYLVVKNEVRMKSEKRGEIRVKFLERYVLNGGGQKVRKKFVEILEKVYVIVKNEQILGFSIWEVVMFQF